MTIVTLAKLINSLSGPEKRYFKLYTRRQSGAKDYIGLFDIIDKTPLPEVAVIRKKFRSAYPSASLNNTAGYLLKVLTDSLVDSKTQKDNFFALMQEVMRAKVLKERSLTDEAYAQLKKTRRSASRSQLHTIEYLTYREELNHLSDANFIRTDDNALIETQMKAKDVLKSLNNIHDHYSLYELLKYRLVYSGRISSDEEKKQLNDLMLSEMTLVAAKSKNSFASQKLHLLFQSFFFTDIGDFQSALRAFHLLNKLFEQNLDLLDHPPLDYLSTLNGIMDNLHTLKKFEEISFYIHKLSVLDKPAYPEYFRYLVRKAIVVYKLAVLTGEGKFAEAAAFISSSGDNVLTLYNMLDEEKQWEIYFFCSLAYFGKKDFKKAHAFISRVMQHHKPQPQLLICKAVRLLNIIIHYEKGDTDYLEYEIRSYKRFFRKQHTLLETESLLLKFISLWPDERRKRIPQRQYEKIKKEIAAVSADKYDKQLLRYFDFAAWVREKLG